jgi:hypothetical protein
MERTKGMQKTVARVGHEQRQMILSSSDGKPTSLDLLPPSTAADQH